MKVMVYTYSTEIKDEIVLTAFSVRDSGEVFYYKFNLANFRKETGLPGSYILPAVSSGSPANSAFGLALSLAAKKRRKETVKQLAKHVEEARLLNRIIQEGKEEYAGFRIERITSIRETSNHAILHCKYKTAYGNEQNEFVKIRKDISGYVSLISACKRLMERTKDICARCGSFMDNGVCPSCGSHDVMNEVTRKQIGTKIGAVISFIIFLICFVTMLLFSGEGQELIHNIMLILSGLSFMVCVQLGYTYYLNRK